MKRLTSLLVFLMSGLVANVDMSVANPPTASNTTTNQTSSETLPYGPGPIMGGVGGVYFLASPGELIIEVQKQDQNRAKGEYLLRAILAGPDRQVIEDVSIPDDDQGVTRKPGPLQTIRLKTKVKRKGIYALNITVSNDRYGDHIIWGFKTNCPRYCIETARGHRNTPHAEPIVLQSPETAGDICFIPRPRELKIDVSGLKYAKPLEVFDADGKTLATLPVNKKGKASYTFPLEVKRDGRPWRLHLPSQRATVDIDGITRWKWGDPEYDMAIWSDDIKPLFPLTSYRWLLSPYHEKIYAKANAEGTYRFTVHNNSDQRATIDLALEFPGEKWTAELASKSLRLGKGESRQIELRYQAPPQGETRTLHLRATPRECPEVSTYSTLIVQASEPSKTGKIETPLQLQPYRWEGEPFGNRPRYPVGHQPYFDMKNRPFVIDGHELTTLRNGTWETTDLREAVKSWSPPQADWDYYASTRAPAKVAFDRDNDVYLLTNMSRKAALLHSADGGKTFSGYLLPGTIPRGTGYDFEQFSGHNTPDGPPPVVRYIMKEHHPDLVFRKVCRLELLVPEKDETGRISFGEPIVLSENALGLSVHSGIPSTIVSHGDKVHVTWAEATDPAKKDGPGAPMYVATYDKKTKKLSKPTLVSHGPPANDGHNTPSITMDSKGYLHVLGGTHNRPFPYTKSLVPNDSAQGWTEPVHLGERQLKQTYIGLVCMPNDSLFTAFRRWGKYEEPFPESSAHAQLAFQSKPADGDWTSPEILLKAAFSHYSIFFHRLTVDRRGRLFLSYCYWPTYFFYRNDRAFDDRSLLMSDDGGKTWAFVKERDFLLDGTGQQRQGKP